MPTNLENSAVATGLEKVSFHADPNLLIREIWAQQGFEEEALRV